MLTIRKEQMQVFEERMRRQFEDRMVKDLGTKFPDQTKTMAEDGLRSLIDAGIEKAKHYGITAEEDVQAFLEYMLIYSPDFDTDPETSWAGEILCREDIIGRLKMRRLKETEPVKRGG